MDNSSAVILKKIIPKTYGSQFVLPTDSVFEQHTQGTFSARQ
jgi:hypothetical protein